MDCSDYNSCSLCVSQPFCRWCTISPFLRTLQTCVMATKPGGFNRTVADLCFRSKRIAHCFSDEKNEANNWILMVVLYLIVTFVAFFTVLKHCLSRLFGRTWRVGLHDIDPTLNQPLLPEDEEYISTDYRDVLSSIQEVKSGCHPWVSVRIDFYHFVYYS